jgi:hypothetical protein
MFTDTSQTAPSPHQAQREDILSHSPISFEHRHASKASQIPSASDSLALSDELERGKWGEKRQHQNTITEISSDGHNSEDSDRSHKTNNADVEDDDDPRSAKRRKLRPSPTINNALTPLDESTPVDNDQYCPPRASRSPSAPVESAPVAEHQEWPFQGFIKRTKIGNETMYNLEFQLSHIPEHLHLLVFSEALGMRSKKEMSAEAATPHNIVAHSKVWLATLQSKRKHVLWKLEENETILKMKRKGCS